MRLNFNLPTILMLLGAIILANCLSSPVPEENPVNQEVTIEDELIILGASNRAGLQLPEYKVWFDTTYQSYALDTSMLTSIKPMLENFKVQMILGTWCSDSQREVPRMYKVLDFLNVPEDNIIQVCVDQSKTKPEELLEKYNFEYVPTFIFINSDKEIGQIVEMPTESLEKDILGFLSES
jgi:hypothetical protein